MPGWPRMDCGGQAGFARPVSGNPGEPFSGHRPAAFPFGPSRVKKKCSWLRVDYHAILAPFTPRAQNAADFTALHTGPQPGVHIDRHAVRTHVIHRPVRKRQFDVPAEEED